MSEQRQRVGWLVGCVVLGAGLRLFRLGHQPLWIDELISLQLATYASGAEFWRGLLIDIHGPFNSGLLHGWVQFGRSEWWLRLLYVIPSLAAIPVVAALARELFRDERVGRVAALALAVSPFHIWYAQEIRSYSWVVLWIAASLLLFLRVHDGRAGRATWIGLSALLAVGLLTNFSVVFLVAALGLLVLMRRPFSWGHLGRFALVMVGVGLVFLPWFLDWFGRIGAERLFVDRPSPTGVPLRVASGFSPLEIPYAAWSFVYGYSLGPSLRALHLDRSVATLLPHLPVLLLGAGAAGWALYQGLRRASAAGRLTFVLTLMLVPLGLLVLLASREIKTFHPRYLVVFFPVLISLIAAAWVAGGRVTRGAVALVGLLALVALGQHYFDPAYGKEDSRAAAQLILDEGAPEDSVVVIYSFRPFRWYYHAGGGEARLHHVHKRFLRTDEEFRAHVAEVQDGADRVWLVLSRWWDVAPEDRIRRLFEESLDERERWEFPGVKVTLYDGGAA